MYRFGLLGKPNVGKSSLFNALLSQNKSIIAKERGVTRDRVKGFLRDGEDFLILADLPGMEVEKSAISASAYIQKHLKKELSTIDGLLVIFDISDISGEDKLLYQAINKNILKNALPTIFIANKVDSEKKEMLLGDLYGVANEDFFLVSAKTKNNIQALRDKIFSLKNHLVKKKILPKNSDSLPNDCVGSFSIIGKPNVGKSSFLNAFLGWQRSITKEESGTTRDLVDEFVFYQDKKYKIIDTAGIRKKKTKKQMVENLSLKKSFHAINQAEVILLIIDAKEIEENFYNLTDQDKKLISLIHSKKKTLLIFFNKWDLLTKKNWAPFKKNITELYPILKKFLLSPLSSKKFFSIERKKVVFKKIMRAFYNHQIEIKTSHLNEALKMAMSEYDTSFRQKKILKIYYATQIKTSPPLFQLYINEKKHLEKKVVDYLHNFLTKYFNLLGTPLHLKFLTNKEKQNEK